mgnify:CR=1 FL=1
MTGMDGFDMAYLEVRPGGEWKGFGGQLPVDCVRGVYPEGARSEAEGSLVRDAICAKPRDGARSAAAPKMLRRFAPQHKLEPWLSGMIAKNRFPM